VSNSLQDIVLTMFRDAHMGGRMYEQNKNSIPPTKLLGGEKNQI